MPDPPDQGRRRVWDGFPTSTVPLKRRSAQADTPDVKVLEGERSAPVSDERIRREARVVGLRDLHAPSLESVERRRMQLWVLTTILLIGVSAGFALLTLLPEESKIVSPNALRIGVVLLTIGFCVYAIEKELHLRKLSRMLVDERVLSTALSNRLHEVSLLLDAGKAINSVLELDSVLDVILRSATDLLGGKSGSIMLVEGDELVASTVRGNAAAQGARVPIGDGIAGRVAITRDALLINGSPDPAEFPGLSARIEGVDSALSVPLMNRTELLGVLNVNAIGQREFSEYELRALSLVFSARDISKIIGQGAARATLRQDQIGTLDAGKQADLVLIDGNPLTDINDLQKVVLTVKGGRIVSDTRGKR